VDIQKDEPKTGSQLVIGKNKTSAISGAIGFIFLGVILIAYSISGVRSFGPIGTVAGVVIILISVYVLVRAISVPGIYKFDRQSDSFSLDEKQLGRISDIVEVTVRNMRGYPVDIVYRDGNSTRLGNYSFKGSATEVANSIADFLGVDVRERGIFG
jgi:hypothetical protein